MKPTRSVLLSALLVMLAVVFAPVAEAQTQATGGTVQGIVTDPDGNALPGVAITVTNNETGRVRTTVSSATGSFRVPLLTPSLYTVRVELTGFQAMERNDVRVTIGSAMDVDMQMGLASVQEVLIVTGQAPLIETSKTQVSTTIDEIAIDSLPILGRNFTDFALLTPGAQIVARNTIGLSGQRGITTAVNIDGASDNSAFFGYQRGGTDSPFTVSQESVKEFQVITSGIMPEFGRSGGGLINVVTKSGTNQWRGGAHFYFRDESLTSVDPFGNEQSEFSVKQFGGNLGGPLVRNEHFIFASVDAQRFSTPYFVRYTVTSAEQAALDAFIALHRPTWDISQSTFSRTNDVVVPFVKADFGISDNTQLTLRVNYSKHETIGGGTDTNLQGNTTATQSSLGDQTEKTISFIGQLTSVLGDRAFNELRVQYGTDNLDRLSNDLLGPDTDIRGSHRIQMGRRFFMPIFVDEKKLQIQDNFSYLFDDHDIKAGVDFETDDTGEFFAAFPVGEFRFSGLDNFFAGDTDFVLQSFGVASPNFENNFDVKQSILALYVQDSWRVNDRLTLNYGLRWEGTFNPEPPGNPALPQTQQIPDDLTGWQPRAGFAYAPNPKTVFRASAGLFTSRTPTLLFFNPFTSVGIPGVGVFFIPSFGPNGQVDGLWPNILPSLPPGITAEQEIYWFDSNFKSSRTLRVNAGFEREVAANLTAGLDYIFARGTKLQTLHDTNLVSGGRDEFGRLIYSGRFQSGVQWKIDRSIGESRYHALILSLKKRFSDGWGGLAHYTYASDKDNDSNERSAGGEQASNIFDLNDDWGFSDRSVKHRVVVAGYGDLPAAFKLAGTFTWRTGTPYSAMLPRDVNGDGESNDRAVIGGKVVERNTFRQPDFKTLDLRLSWEARTNAGSFQVLLDVFNVFNWKNRFTFEDNYLSSRFGIPNTFIGNVRQIQLGLRYSY